MITEHHEYGFYFSSREDVVYDDDNIISQKFKNKCHDIINNLRSYSTKEPNETQKVMKKYLVCLPLFKSTDWSSEHECRLVITTRRQSDNTITCKSKTVKYRGDNLDIPYIELFDDNEVFLPIKEIIIGPSINYESKRKLIISLLNEKGVDPNTVKISKSISKL